MAIFVVVMIGKSEQVRREEGEEGEAGTLPQNGTWGWDLWNKSTLSLLVNSGGADLG